MPVKLCRVAFLGLGTVGQGTLAALHRLADDVRLASGVGFQVLKALVRDPDKPRKGIDKSRLVTDPASIFADPAIDLVVEVMGGVEPARTYVLQALAEGKNVVTANKALIASAGGELLRHAERLRSGLYFGAAVGGGIPVIRVLAHGLVGTELNRVTGVVNGTTNFILNRLEQGDDYVLALSEAQRLGYAEADPSADVEGLDSAQKLAILASMAFRLRLDAGRIPRRGVTSVTSEDLWAARSIGGRIRLVAQARQEGGAVEAFVAPCLVPGGSVLANLSGSDNAIVLEGRGVGRLALVGPGAGGEATGNTVLSDMVAAARTGVTRCTCRDEAALLGPPSAPGYYLVTGLERAAWPRGIRVSDRGPSHVLAGPVTEAEVAAAAQASNGARYYRYLDEQAG